MKMIVVYNEFYSKIFYQSHVNSAIMPAKVNRSPFPCTGCGKNNDFFVIGCNCFLDWTYIELLYKIKF